MCVFAGDVRGRALVTGSSATGPEEAMINEGLLVLSGRDTA